MAAVNEEEEKQDKETSLRMTYFASHGKSGRGLSVRLCCILGGIGFEDVMISRPEHYTQKENNQRRWAGIPEIDIFNKNGKIQKIAQSSTCWRYVGRLSGLYPSNNIIECAFIDEIIDSVEDVINGCFSPIGKLKEDQRKGLIDKLMNNKKDGYGELRLFLDKFELRLKENNEDKKNKNGYFVGDSLSIADLKFFGHFRNYRNFKKYIEW